MVERVGVVLVKDDKLLLIRRHKNGEEYFVLPGGHVEPGESLEEAALREIREECGVTAELGSKVLDFVNTRYTTERQRYVAYLAKAFDGTISKNIGGPESAGASASNSYSLEWFTPKEAAERNVMPAELKNLLQKEADSWI